MTGDVQPWGRWATLGLGIFALLGGQAAALIALTWWFGLGITQMPDFSGDGVAVTIVIFVSIPVQLAAALSAGAAPARQHGRLSRTQMAEPQ